jgi:hypothetical protein
MRFSKFACMFCALLMLIPLSSATELVGGNDENPAEGEAPFNILTRGSPTVDGTLWTLSIEMDAAEHDKGTVFEITTQICTNDGVCDPPSKMTAEMDERVHTISLTPKDDHTYVNWRVKALYEDGNSTNFPQGSWYTTWSSCWQNNGEYGGTDANSAKDGCVESEETPGFGAVIAFSSVAIAAAFIRRD